MDSSSHRPLDFVSRRSLHSLLLLLALGVGPDEVQAATFLWDPNATPAMNDARNWSLGAGVPQSGDSLVFGGRGPTNGSVYNDLTNSTFNIAGITFIFNGEAFNIVGNAFNLTGDITNAGSKLQTILCPITVSSTRTFETTAGGGNLELGYPINGSGGITVAGGGTLILGAANTYTGGTTVNAGATLQFGGTVTTNEGSLTGNITNNGTLLFNRTDIPHFDGIISGSGHLIASGGGVTLTAENTYTGLTIINSGSLLALGNGGTTGSILGDVINNGGFIFNRADSFTFGGAISGSGNIRAAGAGVLTLTGANTYTGTTFINNGSTLQLEGGTNESLAGAVSNDGIFVLNRSGNLSLGGVISGSGSVAVKGSGTVTLTATNTYTGGTTINNGATLQLGDGIASTGSIDPTKPLINNGTFVFNRPANITYDGLKITGTGSVTVNAGVVQLNTPQSYTGPTLIKAGMALVLTIDNTLAADLNASSFTPVTVESTGRLDLANHPQTIGGLAGTGRVYSFSNPQGTAGVLKVNVAANQSYTFSGTLGDTEPFFSFVKSGPGTQIITTNTTYTGTTTLSGGTLQLGSGGTTGTIAGDIVTITDPLLPPPTLAINRSNDYYYDGVISGTGGVTILNGAFRPTKAQTYTGPTQITQGFLVLPNPAIPGSALSPFTTVTVDTAGAFDFSNRQQTIAGLAGAGRVYSFNGSTGILTLDVASGKSYTFSGVLGAVGDAESSQFALVKTGPGTQILSGGNVYSHTTTINAGTLVSAAKGALNTTPTISVTGSGTLAVNYSNSASDHTEADVTSLLNKTSFGGTTTAFAFDTTPVGPNGTATFGTAFTKNSGLTKLGMGTLALSAANSYTGPTTISAGILQVGTGGTTGSLPTGSAIVNNATLAFNRSDTLTQGIDFGAISGGGSVVHAGSGTVFFNGTNTYTGTTTISTGTLAVKYGSASDYTEAQVAALLAKTTFGTTAAAFAFDTGNIGANGTTIYSTPLTMAGSLTKLGLGTLLLTEANTYSGATTINKGTLQVGDGGTTGSLPANNVVTNRGILVFNRSDTVTQGARGTITGGQVIQKGTGRLILNGTNTPTDGIIVTAGTVQVGDGTQSIVLNLTEPAMSPFFQNGKEGTDTITVNNGSMLELRSQTTIRGGNGGRSGGSYLSSTTSGSGGSAIFVDNGSIANLPGTVNVTGGSGAAGYPYAHAGNGGVAIRFASDASLTSNGTITGGKGGDGFGLDPVEGSGYGAAGVVFEKAGVLVNRGAITGGAGGLGAIGYGSAGGNGAVAVSFSAGGSLTNTGAINGGLGGNGGSSGGTGGTGGNGGAGVIFDQGAGSLTNSGLISGALGGNGGLGSFTGSSGSSGLAVIFSGGVGTLSNQSGGFINGNVVMDNFANNVTLESGSKIIGSLNIGNNTSAKLTLTGSGTQLYSGAVTGTTSFAGELTKTGSGQWTLDQPWTYTGPTKVDAGTLLIMSSLGNTAVTVAGEATLAGRGSIGISGGGSTGGSLTLNDGAILSADPTGALLVGGNVKLNGTVKVVLTKAPASNGSGTFVSLLSFLGSIDGTKANLDVSGFRGGDINITLSQIILNFNSVALTWAGNVSVGGVTPWDLTTTANWRANSSAEQFFPGDAVTFDDTGVVKAVTVNTPIIPSSVTFANSAGNHYTLNGTGEIRAGGTLAQSGAGAVTLDLPVSATSLTKSGAGTLTLSAPNSFTGPVTISAGTLALSSTLTSGTGISISGSGALSETSAGAITGSTSLTISGTGTSVLAGPNSYTGATTISGGTLQIGDGGANGSLSPSSTITNNGTLIFNRSGSLSQVGQFGLIGGTGNVVFQGGGTFIFSAANSYTGGTTVSAGTTLQVGAGGLTGDVGGNINNSGTVAFKRGSNLVSNDYIFGGVISGNGGLRQDGSILRLALAQTYTGPTQINTGFLVLQSGAPNTLSTSTVATVAAGAALDLYAQDQTLAGLDGAGTVYSFQAPAGKVLTLNIAAGQTHTFSGNIGGEYANFGFTKEGLGTQVLSGVNSYTGPTKVTGGTLVVDGSISPTATAFTTVSAGATLCGHGRVGVLDGAGLIAPGGSGILTAAQLDPTSGLDFTFKLTLAGTPNFNSATASGNDLLHIVGNVPFNSAFNRDTNVITVDFSGASLAIGQTYLGGFFLDAPQTDDATLNSLLSSANLVYTGIFGIARYDGLVTVPSADFATGSVANGKVMQFTIIAVPEPTSVSLAFLGALGLSLRRRRKTITRLL